MEKFSVSTFEGCDDGVFFYLHTYFDHLRVGGPEAQDGQVTVRLIVSGDEQWPDADVGDTGDFVPQQVALFNEDLLLVVFQYLDNVAKHSCGTTKTELEATSSERAGRRVLNLRLTNDGAQMPGPSGDGTRVAMALLGTYSGKLRPYWQGGRFTWMLEDIRPPAGWGPGNANPSPGGYRILLESLRLPKPDRPSGAHAPLPHSLQKATEELLALVNELNAQGYGDTIKAERLRAYISRLFGLD